MVGMVPERALKGAKLHTEARSCSGIETFSPTRCYSSFLGAKSCMEFIMIRDFIRFVAFSFSSAIIETAFFVSGGELP